MMNAPEESVTCTRRPTHKIIFGFFWGMLGAAAVLALLILLLPGSVFLAISNYLQILAALFAMVALIASRLRCGTPGACLYAAAGFGVWGLANIVWYLTVAAGLRALVFPSIIDLGMIASFLVLAIAFRNGFPKAEVSQQLISGILAFCLIIPAAVMVTAGLNTATIVTFAYFFACGAFLIIGLKHSLAKNRYLLIGSVLFAIAFMIYPLREMFFADNPVLPVIGTFVTAGFALMVIGWLSAQ
jgi:hypothetical protein